MRRIFLFPVLCLMALGTAAADETFNFSYTGGLYSATGTLTAIANGDGSFTAISGTGLYDGIAITLVANANAPNSTTAFFGPGGIDVIYDDQLFPSGASFLDGDGLLFSFNSPGPLGATEVGICGTSGCTTVTTTGAVLTHIPYGSVLNDSNATSDTGTFTLTATPEPSPTVVLVFGIVGLGLVAKRRFSKVQA